MGELLCQSLVRNVLDFPQPGVVFKDLTPVLLHPAAFHEVIDHLVEWASECAPDVVAGIEARGFFFAAPLAIALGLPFVPIRKAGKLPGPVLTEAYALEYGTAHMEVHSDAILPGQRVLIVDDVLATGGTLAAAVRLIDRLGAQCVGIGVIIEIEPLLGRRLLPPPVHALLTY